MVIDTVKVWALSGRNAAWVPWFLKISAGRRSPRRACRAHSGSARKEVGGHGAVGTEQSDMELEAFRTEWQLKSAEAASTDLRVRLKVSVLTSRLLPPVFRQTITRPN